MSVADDRPRVREALEQRQRLRSAVALEQAEEGHGKDASTSPPLSRRTLISGLAGLAAVAAAGTYTVLSRQSSSALPIPAGQIVGPEYLAATLAKQPAPKVSMPTDGRVWSHCVGQSPSQATDLDLVLAVDTTGSMGGVLSDVKMNLHQLIASLQQMGGGVRVGLVAYKDVCDREMIRPLPLTALDPQGVGILSGFISGLQAGGGCDWPEKMDAALDAATTMAWRGDIPSSIVVIADAPVHPQDESTALEIATAFRTKLAGAQVSLIDTGSGGHPFMSALPRRGGGQYVTYDGHILKSLLPAITGCPS